MFEVGGYVTFRSEQEFNNRFDLWNDENVIKKNNKWDGTYKIVEVKDRAVLIQLKNYPHLSKVSINRLKLVYNTILISRRAHVKNNTPS